MCMRAMKDSGIEWAPRIPESWNVKKAKYNFVNTKYIPGIRSAGYDRLALTMKGVIHRSKDDADGLQPKDFLTYQLLRKGELVFKLIDLQNVTTSRVGLAHDTGLVSPAYIILKATGEVLPEFAEKYFLMLWHREIFNALGDNGVRSNLNTTDLLNVPICYPSTEEQQAIVSFLDGKCAEIDALSTDIQSEIDTLESYKRSVITEAVTKGLDRNVEMKDSRMPWVGNVPQHWLVEKVKYHLIRYEPRNPGDQQVLSVYREYGVIPKDSRDDNHNVTSEDTSKYKYVKPGNLVINKMKAWQGSMGVSEYEGIVSPAYFIYRFTDNILIPKYLHYLFRSCYKDEFRRISGGIREGQWDLSPEAFANTLILLPPVDEQIAIVDAVDKKTTEIESIVAQKQEQLDVLADYKKSVIYEYVTGKKEVPVEHYAVAVAIDPHVYLAGMVLDRLGKNQKGKVALEKLLYLIDYHIGLGLNTQYYRYPHGPYDLSLNNYLDVLQEKQWFEKIPGRAEKFEQGKRHSLFRKETDGLYLTERGKIRKLITFTKKMKNTTQLERVATLFASWNDLIIEGNQAPTDEEIIHRAITGWTPNKANFAELTWKDTLNKMRSKGIIPKGQGLHTLPMPERGDGNE